MKFLQDELHYPYILIVDDEETSIQILKHGLLKLGYDSIAFSSGQATIDYLKNLTHHNFPLAIISDIMMDDGDGIDILSMTRSNPQMASIPFIFFSNVNRDLFSDLIKPYNCDAFVNKPVDFQKIKFIVENLKFQMTS